VEINLLGEAKGRTGSATKRRGCLGFGGVFLMLLSGLLAIWVGIH
jgi:hypothetical protein